MAMAFYLTTIKKLNLQLRNWIPALLVMGIIFLFSSQSSAQLPNFDWADKFIKKGGHMIGYALLAFAYWHGFGMQSNRRGLSWLLALLYALTDEVHQSFVPGRHPTIWDVLIFDNLGALISLWLAGKRTKQKRPD